MKNSYNSNAEIAISRSHRAHNLKSNDCALRFFIIAPGVMHSIPSRAEDRAPPVSWTDLQPAFVGEAPEAMLAWAALHLKRTYFRAMNAGAGIPGYRPATTGRACKAENRRTASVIPRQRRDVNRSPDPVLKITAVASSGACDRSKTIRPIQIASLGIVRFAAISGHCACRRRFFRSLPVARNDLCFVAISSSESGNVSCA